jgi:cytochrome c553
MAVDLPARMASAMRVLFAVGVVALALPALSADGASAQSAKSKAGASAAATKPAAPDPKLAEKIAECALCHGEENRKKLPQVPVIDGQPKLALMYQLFFFREGRRKNPEMNEFAKNLTDAELDVISEHFSRQKHVLLPPTDVDRGRFERGAALAARRHCASCHNPDYSGREQMPRLVGQSETYLVKAFQDYRSGARVGTQAAMAETITGMTDADFADLAHYLANLRP